MAVIGGKIFINNPKNLNHVHKYTKYFLSVIITLGGNIRAGGIVLCDRVKTSELGSRAPVLKHLYGRMIFGQFEKKIHEGTIWRLPRAVISFIVIKQIFPHFYSRKDHYYN